MKCELCLDEGAELTCTACKKGFHEACFPPEKGRDGTLVCCETCSQITESINSFYEEYLVKSSAVTQPDRAGSNPSASSTLRSPSETIEERVDRLAATVESLVSIVETMARAPASRPATIVTQGIVDKPVPPNSANGESANNGSSTASHSVSSTRSAIEASIRHEPLTKQQRECRARDSALPTFDGSPDRWLVFYTSYLETTEACAFSPSENMKRLEKALKGEAEKEVKHLFDYPHLLDRAMARLEEFVRPKKLMASAIRIAEAAPTLKADLTNIGLFFIGVEKVRNVIEMLGTAYSDQVVLDQLEEKLPTSIGIKWIESAAQNDRTFLRFYHFIEGIYDTAMQLPQRGQSGGSRAPARLMLLEDRGELPDAPPSAQQSSSCFFGCSELHPWPACPKLNSMSINERWDATIAAGRCFGCFGRHRVFLCRSTKRCGVNGCNRKHHTLLHTEEADPAQHGGFVGVANTRAGCTLFRVLPVILQHGGCVVHTYALMDSGSSVTLMRTSLARRLGLTGKTTSLALAGATGRMERTPTEMVSVTISGAARKERMMISAMTMDRLELPRQTVSAELLANEGLSHIPLSPLQDAQPELLIGQDNARLMIAAHTQIGRSGGVIASETVLGWIVEGRDMGLDLAPSSYCGLTVGGTTTDDLEERVRAYIEEDGFGLGPDSAVKYDSDENTRALRFMEDNTKLVGQRYETRLLWKDPEIRLIDNFEMAMKRHLSFRRKLEKSPELYKKVAALISDYVKKGYITQVEKVGECNWYLPIFTVTSPSKPGKVRVVWDAAAEYKGRSLNSALVTGPDLTASLVHILIRFRRGRIAFTADIQEMFLRVMVHEDDRWAQQFLWQDPGDENITTYRMNVLTFGATCSPTLAQFAKNRNADRFAAEHPLAVAAIKDSTYVDDYLQSCDTEEEAIYLATTVTSIYQAGGMRLCKFHSNSQRLLEVLSCSGNSDQKEVSHSEMVLGLQWHPETDLLSFRSRGDTLQALTAMNLPTKRKLLRLAMSLFDPLGLVAFLTILPRLVLRETWRQPLDWDHHIPDELRPMWRMTTDALKDISTHEIPRWHGTINGRVTVHVFCDASDKTIAATVYLVYSHEAVIISSLCLAKARVAPLKYKSIPRLELHAALLGFRLLMILLQSDTYDVERVVMWSDALDVLFWIRRHQRRYSTYVANRVAHILDATAVGDWRHVPTHLNPADWATKWDVREDYSLWWNGPAFLHEGEAVWPDRHDTPEMILEIREVLHVRTLRAHPLIPNPANFSSCQSFLYNTAVVMQVGNTLMKRRDRGPITAEEREQAHHFILKWTQEELNLSDPFITRLSPYQDENDELWRMRGRTANAKFMDYDARHPVILPRNHPVTTLLIRHFHVLNQHLNVERVLNELRQWYVVDKPWAALNAEIRSCPRCILRRAKPINPEMAALPTCRLASGEQAFSYVGVDAFGPLYVTNLRRKEKRWGLLFTCLTTRAVYIALVNSLDAASCMVALDSLCTHRDIPVELYSDNGTNFVAAAKQWRAPNGDQPKWRFNPPGTPHMGGSWERLIGSTKRLLNAMATESAMPDQKLRHLLVRIEFMINTRPLTDVPGDPLSQDALTPNLIINGTTSGRKARARASTQPDLLRMARDRDERLQEFWRRFTLEYVPTIAVRSKWRKQVVPIAPGDLVYVCDGDYQQGWLRGEVTETFPDHTGQVRQARVRLADNKVIRCSAARLAVIRFPTQVQPVEEGEDVEGY